MSNFWATRLGVAPPPAPAPAPAPVMPGGYSPSPYFQPVMPQQQPQPQQQALPAQEQHLGDLLQGDLQQIPQKALSARSTATCPECGSGDIFKPHGVPNAMEQCYACGYNPRFAHSTAGGGLPSDASAPSTPSRQLNPKGTSNFNPQTIVGKV